jgi:trehalose 6-phosphate synthase/phosphatase
MAARLRKNSFSVSTLSELYSENRKREEFFLYIRAVRLAADSTTLQFVHSVGAQHRWLFTRDRRASRRLLMLDYDGTLVPFARQPWQATPPPAVLRHLTSLAVEPRNCVALTSGGTAEDLDRWFGAIRGIWLVAEHGAELKSLLRGFVGASALRGFNRLEI